MTHAGRRTTMLRSVLLAIALLAFALTSTAPSAAAPGSTVAPVLAQYPFLVNVGDHVFFAARDGRHGRELWTSDGTPGGTRLVKDIRKDGSSNPGWNTTRFNDANMVAVGQRVFFVADDGVHGQELWVSDGTRTGTHLVRDIFPGRASAEVRDMTAVGNRLYFVLVGKQHSHLWKTDGTSAHTKRVRSSGGQPVDPHTLYFWHGQLFFVAQGRGVGDELWKSGGTPGTTTLVKDIRPQPWNSRIQSFAGGSTRLYFVANDGPERGHGNIGIWRTDGTRAGTQYVRNVYPGRASLDVKPVPHDLTTLGDQLLFADTDCVHGPEPWSSDGTFDGTIILDLQPGTSPGACGLGSNPGGLRRYQNHVYLVATVDGQPALWRTDGTVGGTELMLDLTTHSTMLKGAGTTLFVWEYADLTHCRVQAGDGTAVGTTEIHTFAPDGDACPDPRSVTDSRDLLFFVVDGALWTSDGTSGGTGPVMAP